VTAPRHPATTAIHAGESAVAGGNPVVLPVERTVIHRFASAADFARVMDDSGEGYLYSRIRNPNSDELAAAVAALEGAEAALCFASGMAAIQAAVALLAPPGSGVVAGPSLYGQTHAMLRDRPDLRWIDTADLGAVREAAEGAALVYVETIASGAVSVADLPGLAAAARESGARLLVDSTYATPIGCRPLELGADMVVHSATKYLNGHSDVLAGVAAGPRELIGPLALRLVDTGAVLAPDAAWLVRRGLKTLPLRWERSCANALELATRLEAHPRVSAVAYPGLPGHRDHAIARTMLNGYGAVLSFEVEGGRSGGEAVMDGCTLCVRATSLGGIETLISHPASTTHRQLSADELQRAGITEGMLRLCVGCEDVTDLWADLEQALS